MKPIKSTYEILAWKHLNRSVDEKWSDWAVEMMMQGFETEHLVELAGISKPFNQFELKELTDNLFAELGLDFSDKEKVLKSYATFLIEKVLNREKDTFSTLCVPKDLCIELDYEKNLYDFYSLYFAKYDLKYDEIQHYWHGADRTNIDSICLNYFTNWVNENPL